MNDFLSEGQLKERHDEQIKQLEAELAEKDSALKEYRKAHGKLEVFFSRIIEYIEPIEPFQSVFNKAYKKKAESEIIPVMHNTDAHMGAVQQGDEIEHFNEFNPELCDKRILGFTGGFIEWVQLHRNAYNIKRCNVVFTGDLISGDIHDELRVTNAFPVPQQCVRAAQVYAKQITLLAPHFETVTVDFLTEDNHSRLTKKPQAKEAGINSYGYLIGKLIEAYISKVDNVVFNIHAMHEKVISISNMNYLITHMHGVKSWMGIPWYGIQRRTAREAMARQTIIMDDVMMAKEIGFNKIIHGHFHEPFNSSLSCCGGSVSGTDAYDHQSGRHAKPSQSIWMIHPKWGEFNRSDFQLERYDGD